MTDGTTVLPDGGRPSGSTLLRVQASSKLAFVATTAALVTLASGGIAVLVSHGTAGLSRPSALRGGSLLTDPGAGAVVVERAPGTYAPTPAVPFVGAGPTEQARQAPIAQRTPSFPVAVLDGSQGAVQPLAAPQVAVIPAPVVVPAVPVPDVLGVVSPTTAQQGSHGKAAVHAYHVVVHPRDTDRGGSGRGKHVHSGPHPV